MSLPRKSGTPEIISAKLSSTLLIDIHLNQARHSHASCTPDIDTRTVRPRSQQNIRRPVPERHDLIAERIHRYAERSRQSEIPDLEFASFVDEQVLWLEITVQDTIVVAVGDALNSQEQMRMDVCRKGGCGHTLRSWYMKLLTISGCSAPFSPLVSMYFLRSCSQNCSIRQNKHRTRRIDESRSYLEHENQPGFSMLYIMKSDDVGMLQL